MEGFRSDHKFRFRKYFIPCGGIFGILSQFHVTISVCRQKAFILLIRIFILLGLNYAYGICWWHFMFILAIATFIRWIRWEKYGIFAYRISFYLVLIIYWRKCVENAILHSKDNLNGRIRRRLMLTQPPRTSRMRMYRITNIPYMQNGLVHLWKCSRRDISQPHI